MGRYSLKKRSGKRRLKESVQFGVYDIESRNWSEHVVSAFYTKDKDGFEVLEFFKRVDDFLEFCFDYDRNPCEEIWCHFGGIFDFLFILNEAMFYHKRFDVKEIIPRGSGMLSIKVFSVKNNRHITFRDSSAILPFGLDSITENFGVQNKKGNLDRTRITRDTKEVREYLESDVKGLWQSLTAFREWTPIKEAGHKSTIAGQAIEVLRLYLMRDIPCLNKSQDAFIRRGYYGGRTEILKPLYHGKKKELNYYDINSLYPYVMANNNIPTDPLYKTNSFKFGKDTGFVEATVLIPKDMYIPPLPTMFEVGMSKKLIFPVGEFTGVWASCELEYAMSLGVKVKKVHQALLFKEPWPVFKSFINAMYEVRQKSKKNSVDNVLAKLLMNSCYGRFGLKRERECISVGPDDSNAKFYQPISTFWLENGCNREIYKYKEEIETFSNVGVAAWVTALARIENHKTMMKFKEDVYYTDTDSFFTPKKAEITNDLGGLKLEYSLSQACFLLPKTYIIEAPMEIFSHKTKTGQKIMSNIKSVMKGFDRDSIRNITFNDFVDALEGDLRRLRTVTPAKLARMRTAFREGKALALTKESTRAIKSLYDKRKLIKTASGYDTQPWIIENNKIINMEQ